MRRTHLLGLFLWRTGLLIAGSYSLLRAARYLMRYVELPDQIEWGLGIALTGAALVALSFVLERFQDSKREEGLSE